MSIENSVLNLIKEPILKKGYTNVYVTYTREMGSFYLRVLLDKDDVISLEEIIEVTDLISPMLDEADLISNEYILDVTSLGAEKPLDLSLLEKYVGKYVHLHLSHPWKGENILEGDLESVTKDEVTLTFRVKTRLIKATFPRQDVDQGRLAIKF